MDALDKVKLIFEKLISVWKSKVLFRRAIYTALLAAAITGVILGNHHCKTKWFEYDYDSPVESWKGGAK